MNDTDFTGTFDVTSGSGTTEIELPFSDVKAFEYGFRESPDRGEWVELEFTGDETLLKLSFVWNSFKDRTVYYRIIKRE